MSNIKKILDSIMDELELRNAIDPVVIDVQGISSFCDFIIIASMDSERGVKSLSNYLNEKLKKKLKINTKNDGISSPSWIVIDTGDIMVHLFHKETRKYYDLESLWQSSKKG